MSRKRLGFATSSGSVENPRAYERIRRSPAPRARGITPTVMAERPAVETTRPNAMRRARAHTRRGEADGEDSDEIGGEIRRAQPAGERVRVQEVAFEMAGSTSG